MGNTASGQHVDYPAVSHALPGILALLDGTPFHIEANGDFKRRLHSARRALPRARALPEPHQRTCAGHRRPGGADRPPSGGGHPARPLPARDKARSSFFSRPAVRGLVPFALITAIALIFIVEDRTSVEIRLLVAMVTMSLWSAPLIAWAFDMLACVFTAAGTAAASGGQLTWFDERRPRRLGPLARPMGQPTVVRRQERQKPDTMREVRPRSPDPASRVSEAKGQDRSPVHPHILTERRRAWEGTGSARFGTRGSVVHRSRFRAWLSCTTLTCSWPRKPRMRCWRWVVTRSWTVAGGSFRARATRSACW